MTLRRLGIAAVFLLVAARVEAGKEPLSPDELEKQSKAIVTGQVVSHWEEDDKDGDPVTLRSVFLKVKIDSVVRGDLKPDTTITCRCWTVVKEPRNKPMGAVGHDPIPSDGGRAKFYLRGRGENNAWIVLDPNGVELLDQTPPLRYLREQGDPIPEPAKPHPATRYLWLAWLLGGAVIVLVVLTKRRRGRPKPPSV